MSDTMPLLSIANIRVRYEAPVDTGSVDLSRPADYCFLMRPMRVMARFNRRATNKLIGLWAPRLPPWAVLVHRGRKTGTTYRTPVAAFVHDGSFAVPIGYGEESDWLRNILAAGSGELVRRGRCRVFTNPRVIDRGEVDGPSRITKRSLVADFVT